MGVRTEEFFVDVGLDKGVDFFTIFDRTQGFPSFPRSVYGRAKEGFDLEEFASVSDNRSIVKEDAKA